MVLFFQGGCCTTHIWWIIKLAGIVALELLYLMQGKKQFQERLFVSFQLSEHIPQDNFYRKLKEAIDFGFLYRSLSMGAPMFRIIQLTEG
jgi:hypothetical protein